MLLETTRKHNQPQPFATEIPITGASGGNGKGGSGGGCKTKKIYPSTRKRSQRTKDFGGEGGGGRVQGGDSVRLQ